MKRRTLTRSRSDERGHPCTAEHGGRIDFFLSLHNDEVNEYLSPPLTSKFSSLRQKVFDQLRRTTSFDPGRDYDASPPKAAPPEPGRMDVAEALCYQHSVPAFLMEQRIARVGKLGRCPTIDDRMEFGKGLVKSSNPSGLSWRSSLPARNKGYIDVDSAV